MIFQRLHLSLKLIFVDNDKIRIILDDPGISPLLPIHSPVNALGIENCPFISEMNFLIDRRVPFYYARHLIKD